MALSSASANTRGSTQTITLRNPPHSYFHLRVRSLAPQSPTGLDEVTIRSYLTAALQQYLGLTGTAIPIDVLKVEDANVWVRVPYEDEVAVTAAVSQWVSSKGFSMNIEARGTWLGGVVAKGRVSKQKFWSLEHEGG